MINKIKETLEWMVFTLAYCIGYLAGLIGIKIGGDK